MLSLAALHCRGQLEVAYEVSLLLIDSTTKHKSGRGITVPTSRQVLQLAGFAGLKKASNRQRRTNCKHRTVRAGCLLNSIVLAAAGCQDAPQQSYVAQTVRHLLITLDTTILDTADLFG